MLKTYKFDIIALTETWLCDNEHAVNYAQIPGYNLEINNRNTGQRVGGVGFYIKDKITYKGHQGIKIDSTVECLFIEVGGTSKSNFYPMSTFYQPSPKDSEKEKWLEKFENIISQISIKWDHILVLAGDFNINLLNQNQTIVGKYKNILETFNLT